MLNGKDGFLSTDRIKKFSKHRNDPNQPEALSNLSPYYHFGHLAAQRAALEASKLRSKAKVGSIWPVMLMASGKRSSESILGNIHAQHSTPPELWHLLAKQRTLALQQDC